MYYKAGLSAGPCEQFSRLKHVRDIAGSWSWALFAPSAFFFVTGAAVFCTLGSSEAQDFSDDRPFWCACFECSNVASDTCQGAAHLVGLMMMGGLTYFHRACADLQD